MSLVNCYECKKEVSATAKVCPHCGVKKPAVSPEDKKAEQKKANKGCLSVFAVVLLISFIVSLFGGDTKWYEGGTLHQSTVKEWKQATTKNKLATAADWVLVFKSIKTKVKESGDFNTLKPFSESLITCIDKATVGITTIDHQKTTQSAVVCGTLMGW